MTRIEYCDMILEKLPEAKVLFQKSISHISVLQNGQDHGGDEEEDIDPNHTSNEPGVDHIPLTFEGRRDSILDEIVEEKKIPVGTIPPAAAAAPSPPPARGVAVKCSDGSTYSGHILICNAGDSLQDKLAALDLDLDSDLHNSSPGGSFTEGSQSKEIQYFLCGVTDTMDSQRYPLMKEDTTQLNLVLDDRSGLTVRHGTFQPSPCIVFPPVAPVTLVLCAHNFFFLPSFLRNHSGGQQPWWTIESHGR